MHVVSYSAMLFSVTLSTHAITVIVIAAVIEWLLGALWYGLVFRKSWLVLAGFSETNKPKNGAMTMVFSFIACLLLTFVIAHVVGWAGAVTLTQGIKFGVICWLGFMAPPIVYPAHSREPPRQSVCHQRSLLAAGDGHWRRPHGSLPRLAARSHGPRQTRRLQGQFPRGIAPLHFIAATR